MKKSIVGAILLVFMTASFALADWAEDFVTTAGTSGEEAAVLQALGGGVALLDILKLAQENEAVDVVAVITALYYAGVSGSEIEAAAKEAGIPEEVLVAGNKQSVGSWGPAEQRTYNPLDFPQNPQNSAGRGTTDGQSDYPGGQQPQPPTGPPDQPDKPPVVPPPVIPIPPPSVSPDRF